MKPNRIGKKSIRYQSKTAQVVLLVDCSVGRQTRVETDWIIASVQLAVLRILSYFEHSSEYKLLRWGYKFYKLDSLPISANKHAIWKDFNTKDFKEFEELIDASFRREMTLVQTPRKHSHILKESLGYMQKPHADNYANVLRAVIEDFQWEAPDISSPVKIGKHQELSVMENYVFNFHIPPTNKTELSDFVSCPDRSVQCASARQLLSCIMSESARQRWRSHERMIQLYWVNSSVSQQLNITKELSSLYEKMLELLGGGLISLNQLIDKRLYKTEDVESYCLKKLPPLPFCDVVKSLTGMTKRVFSLDKMTSGGCITLCRKSGDDVVQFQLQPMFPHNSVKDFGQAEFLGIVPHHLVSLSVMDSSSSCLCTSDSNHKNIWELLLSELSTGCNMMVLKLLVTESIALLQPLSSISATLTLVTDGNKNEIMDLVTSYTSVKINKTGLPLRDAVRQVVEKMVANESSTVSDISTDNMDKFVLESLRVCETLQPGNRDKVEELSGNLVDPWYSKPHVLTDVTCSPPNSKLLHYGSKLHSDISSLRESYREKMLPNDVVRKVEPVAKPLHSKKIAQKSSQKDLIKLHASKGAQLVEKSKQRRTLQKQSLENEAKEVKPRKIMKKIPLTTVGKIDFKDEGELITYINKSYEDACTGQADVVMTSQSIVSIAQHFYKQDDDCVRKTSNTIQLKMIKTPRKIRNSCRADLSRKSRECQMQTLLLLELKALEVGEENAIQDSDDNNGLLVSKISKLLTTMSLGMPELLTSFLNDVVSQTYQMTMPKLLYQLFKDLGQDPPKSFLQFRSPISEAPTSEKSNLSPTLMSCSSLRSEDSQSMRAIRNFSQRSMSDMSCRRSIAVPGELLMKDKKVRKRRSHNVSTRTRSRTPGKKSEPTEFEPGFLMKIQAKEAENFGSSKQSDAQVSMKCKVKRDLFASPSTRKSPRRAHRKRHSIGKCSYGLDEEIPLVAETPVHKQGSARLLTHSAADISLLCESTIDESPDKFGILATKSANDKPSTRFQRRTSFYDVEKLKSRNAAKFDKLENRMKCAFGTDKCTPRRLTHLILKEAITSQNVCSKITPTTAEVPHSPLFAERMRHRRSQPSQATDSIQPAVVATPQKDNLKKKLFKTPELKGKIACNVSVSESVSETPLQWVKVQDYPDKNASIDVTPKKSRSSKIQTPTKNVTELISTPRKVRTPIRNATESISTPNKLKTPIRNAAEKLKSPVKNAAKLKMSNRSTAEFIDKSSKAKSPTRSTAESTVTPQKIQTLTGDPDDAFGTPRKKNCTLSHNDQKRGSVKIFGHEVSPVSIKRKRERSDELLLSPDLQTDGSTSAGRKKVRTGDVQTCQCGNPITPSCKGRKSPFQQAATCNSQTKVCKFATHNTPPPFHSSRIIENSSPQINTPTKASVASFHRRKFNRSPSTYSGRKTDNEVLLSQLKDTGNLHDKASPDDLIERKHLPQKHTSWDGENKQEFTLQCTNKDKFSRGTVVDSFSAQS